MSRRQRRGRRKRLRHERGRGHPGKRIAAGAGLSLGATLGLGATAQAADFTVSSTADTVGGGTLRQAISDANANNNDPAVVDRILFQSNVTGTISLGSQLPVVEEPLQILGPGAGTLTISGNDSNRIMRVTSSGPVGISGLTLIDGDAGLTYGGAIYSDLGGLTIERSVILSSSASDGGGVAVNSTDLTIRNSTIAANNAAAYGGAVRATSGTTTIQGSTISGNTSQGDGGGVYFGSEAATTIQGSTISGNRAISSGGGIYSKNGTPDPALTSTIVANNTAGAGPDLRGGGGDAFNVGFSLIENASGAGINQTGPNVLGQDPQLGALASNGGPTATHALPATSPALEKGSATGSDQRGLPRPFEFLGLANAAGGNGADIGAFEFQGKRCLGLAETRPSITGTSGADVIVGTPGADVIGGLGGRDLICAGRGNDRVRGGGGNDTLRGEGGKDTLRGQGGRDRLFGGPGRDQLIGGPLRDKLIGGPGKDLPRQ